MTITQAAVVDFGTSKVVTIIAKGGKRKSERLEIIGTGSVLYDGFRDGDWNTPEKLVESVKNSIAAAELQARQSIHEVYIGVPGEYIKVYTGEATIPITSENGLATVEDVDAIQDQIAEKLKLVEEDGIVLHRSPAWFAVDDGPALLTPLRYDKPGKNLHAKISFVLGDRQFMNDVAELMGLLNITVAGYFSSSLGTAHLMIAPEDRDNTSVLIDVGYLNTEVNVVEGDAIIYHEMLNIGGSELVVALTDGLRVDLKEAERIKRGFSFQPDEYEMQEDVEIRDPYSGRRKLIPRFDVEDVIMPAMKDITGMIRDCMEESGIYGMMSQNSKIYITGGGIAMMKGGRDMLAEALDMPVENMTSKTAKLNYPMFSSALGLTNLVFDALQIDEGEAQKPTFTQKLNIFKKN